MAADNSEEIKKKIQALRMIDWTDEDICRVFKLTRVELLKLSGKNLWAGD
jgi:hypothetical protein